MEKLYACLLSLCILGIALHTPLLAQQVSAPYIQLAEPQLLNPACGGLSDMTRIMVQHQQRGDGGQGWGRVSDFLTVLGPRSQSGPQIGWNGKLSYDREHTQSRFALSPGISAQVLPKGPLSLSFGISGGIILQGHLYNGVPIGQEGDPRVVNDIAAALDAGAGTDFSWNLTNLRGALGIHLDQLPRDSYLGQHRPMTLVHQATAYAGTLFQLSNEWQVGPQFLYRNTWHRTGLSIRKGQMDIAAKAMHPRLGIWALMGYRVHRSGVIAGGGLRLWHKEEKTQARVPFRGLDVSMLFFIPGRNATRWSSAEISLAFTLGRRPPKITNPDILHPMWGSTENTEYHKRLFLEKVSPKGLEVKLDTTRKGRIILQYTIPDNTRQYAGHKVEWGRDTLIARVGPEWEGVDGFMDAVDGQVLEECLSPDPNSVSDTLNLDSLQKLLSLELIAHIKYDHIAILGGEGIPYTQDLHRSGQTEPLRIRLVINDSDTTVVIPNTKHFASNLELSSLKMYALKLLLMEKLLQYYDRHGQRCVILDEGSNTGSNLGESEGEELIEDSRPVVYVKFRKIRIESDYLNQDAFQNTLLRLEFLKRAGEEQPQKRKIIRDPGPKIDCGGDPPPPPPVQKGTILRTKDHNKQN